MEIKSEKSAAFKKLANKSCNTYMITQVSKVITDKHSFGPLCPFFQNLSTQSHVTSQIKVHTD